jgi:hypothetical protein
MATRGPGLLPAANGAVAPLAAALVQLVDASQLLPADADQMICGGARTCANAGCSSEWRATGGRDRMLFACAQCAVTLYCSVECQVRARAAAVSHNRLLALAICCCVVVIVVVAAAVSVSHRPACSLRRAQEEDLQYHRAACMCAAQTRRLLDEDAARDAARVADESDSLGADVGGGAEEDGDTESTPAATHPTPPLGADDDASAAAAAPAASSSAQAGAAELDAGELSQPSLDALLDALALARAVC